MQFPFFAASILCCNEADYEMCACMKEPAISELVLNIYGISWVKRVLAAIV